MTSFAKAPDFEFEFPSGDLGTRNALGRLRDFLKSRSLTADISGYIELAIAEVLNNVVEHAYPPGNPQGVVNLRSWHSGVCLRFEVTDRGTPMPDGKIPLGNPPKIDVAFDDLPEGGFGWFLIRTMVREISYERRDDTNHLYLHFDVTALP